MDETKTIVAIKPPPTSKIATTPEVSLSIHFPLSISFDEFKYHVVSSFSQNGTVKPIQNFLFFPELSNKPLDFENENSIKSMKEVFQTINFEKIYFYNFPFVHFSCMLNASRLLLILPDDQGTITHFFRDDTPIHKIIEFAYQKQWIDSKVPYNLVYRKKNGLIKRQLDPFSLALEAKNPIYFCSFHTDNCPFNFKDIFIPIEFIKKNESTDNSVESNFLLKIIDEEPFEKTLPRIQKIYSDLPENCVFKLYNKEYGEVEVEPESVLSYEKDVILRIYNTD